MNTLRQSLPMLLFVVLISVAMIGWGLNIAKIIELDVLWPPSGMLVIRIIGVFVLPLGAVVGYL